MVSVRSALANVDSYTFRGTSDCLIIMLLLFFLYILFKNIYEKFTDCTIKKCNDLINGECKDANSTLCSDSCKPKKNEHTNNYYCIAR